MSKKPGQKYGVTGSAPEHPPIKITVPSQLYHRMEAIVNLSKAIHECAKALNTTPANISVSNCTFSNTKFESMRETPAAVEVSQ